MKDNKKRLFEVMGKLDSSFKSKLNESDAFNDAGEPTMTHQQYREYSEPAEDDFDMNDYEREGTPYDIIKQVGKHFNTIIPSYGGDEYTFMTTRDADGDLMIWFVNNMVNAVGVDDKRFPEQNIEDLDINELLQFLEPYRRYMVTGEAAQKQIEQDQRDNARDAEYARQERSAMGGGLGEGLEGQGDGSKEKLIQAFRKNGIEVLGVEYAKSETGVDSKFGGSRDSGVPSNYSAGSNKVSGEFTINSIRGLESIQGILRAMKELGCKSIIINPYDNDRISVSIA